MNIPLLLLALSVSSPPQSETAQGDAGWRMEALDLQAQGRFDHAVIRIEEHLKLSPEDAEGWRAYARGLEQFVDEGGGAWFAMQDAGEAWERSLELEPFDLDAIHAAGWTRLRLGDWAEAEAHAQRGVGAGLLLEGDVPPRFLTLACRARIGAVREVPTDDVDAWSAAVAEAGAVFRNARGLAPESAELDALEASLFDTLGVPGLAIERLRGAIARSPGAPELHGLLVELYLRDGMAGRLAELYDTWTVEPGEDDATLVWYAALAERHHGDHLQRERRFDLALQAYAFCAAHAAASAKANPEYEATTLELRQQAEVSSIWCLIEKGAFDAAQERLIAVLRARPEMRDYRDGLYRSAMNAAARLGQERVALYRFADAAEVGRVLVEVDPENGRWWNNLGFLLREYATQIESGAIEGVEDPAALAKETFRESWRAYVRAAELSPEDARVVNDAALIQVYHLREELELAEEMLWRSIRTGEAQLEELGPETMELLRFPIAQAVGDAYENLGYLYYHVKDQPQESRRYWEASLATDSGERAHFQAYFDSIDGNGEPVAERDSAGFVPGPLDEAPERAYVPWEASLAEARARAEEAGRPLVLYNKGEGLGLATPYLDRFVRSPEFAERTSGSVLLVADALRHAFVDRRRDGRRLPCPKWGAITCAEHLAVAAEFEDVYREQHGAAPGESEEAIFLQPAGGDDLTQLSTLEVFQDDLAAFPPPQEPDGIAAAEANAVAEMSAEQLVHRRSRAAREIVEERLLDSRGAVSDEERMELVRALAADDHPASVELLTALAYQEADPVLAAMALSVWPRRLDDAPAEHALRWSGWPEVRSAAESVLARDPDELARRRAIAGVLEEER